MKVEFSDEAKAQVESIDAWWRENRQAAPDLFTNELDQALLALEDMPTLGARYEPRPKVRRLLSMPMYSTAGLHSCGMDRVNVCGAVVPPRLGGGHPLHPIYAPLRIRVASLAREQKHSRP